MHRLGSEHGLSLLVGRREVTTCRLTLAKEERLTIRRLIITATLLAALLVARPVVGAGHTHARWSPWARFWVTGYDERGYTASGAYTGWGVAATDTSVIPMYSTFQVRGLGTYTALDTGGAVVGRHVDLWWPTAAQCFSHTGWYFVRFHR